MVQVINSEFYHIHTHDNILNGTNNHSHKWMPGRILFFGNDGNLENGNTLNETMLNPRININMYKDLIKKLSIERLEAKTAREKEIIQSEFYKQGLFSQCIQLTREIVLEEVRKELFPNEPSRLNAIWLTNLEYKQRWLEIFSEFKFPVSVFLINFTGKLHKADARWITDMDNPLNFDSYHKNAVGYWSGENKSDRISPDEEFLGNGYVEILEEIRP
jgi:hypothetical protein